MSLRKNLTVVPSDSPEPNQVKERISLFDMYGNSIGVPAARLVYSVEIPNVWPVPDPFDGSRLDSKAANISNYISALPDHTIRPDGVNSNASWRKGLIEEDNPRFHIGDFDYIPSSSESWWEDFGWSFDTPPGLFFFNVSLALRTETDVDLVEAEYEKYTFFHEAYEEPAFTGETNSDKYSGISVKASVPGSTTSYLWIDGSGFFFWDKKGIGINPMITQDRGAATTNRMFLTKLSYSLFYLGTAGRVRSV